MNELTTDSWPRNDKKNQVNLVSDSDEFHGREKISIHCTVLYFALTNPYNILGPCIQLCLGLQVFILFYLKSSLEFYIVASSVYWDYLGKLLYCISNTFLIFNSGSKLAQF